MRLRFPVRTASCRPVSSSRTELREFLYSWRFSRLGRSWATAIIIPKTVETTASAARPARISAIRSL